MKKLANFALENFQKQLSMASILYVFYVIYLILIALPILVVVTTIAALCVIIGSALGGSRVWGYYPGRYWAKIFCWLTFVRVKVHREGQVEKNKSYVFVANHQGAFDIFAIYGYLGHNFRWMMKKSLEKIPLVGYACRVSGHIYVDNSTPAGVRRTMETAEQRLAGGMSVVVFPEGSRTRDGKMHAFRRGAFTLAVEFGLPVVPVTIDGAYRVFRRGTYLPHPGSIKLTIHEPILPGEGGKHELAELMEKSAAAVASALPK